MVKLETTVEERAQLFADAEHAYNRRTGVKPEKMIFLVNPERMMALLRDFDYIRELGQEDVLKFVRNGKFLHDQAPTKKFAEEIEQGWHRHGKAAVKED
jgi:hypothetical protein